METTNEHILSSSYFTSATRVYVYPSGARMSDCPHNYHERNVHNRCAMCMEQRCIELDSVIITLHKQRADMYNRIDELDAQLNAQAKVDEVDELAKSLAATHEAYTDGYIKGFIAGLTNTEEVENRELAQLREATTAAIAQCQENLAKAAELEDAVQVMVASAIHGGYVIYIKKAEFGKVAALVKT